MPARFSSGDLAAVARHGAPTSATRPRIEGKNMMVAARHQDAVGKARADVWRANGKPRRRGPRAHPVGIRCGTARALRGVAVRWSEGGPDRSGTHPGSRRGARSTGPRGIRPGWQGARPDRGQVLGRPHREPASRLSQTTQKTISAATVPRFCSSRQPRGRTRSGPSCVAKCRSRRQRLRWTRTTRWRDFGTPRPARAGT